MSDERSDRQVVVLLAVAVEGGLVVLAWFLGWLLHQMPLRSFDWDAGAALRGSAATLPLLVLFAVLVRWPVGPFGRIKRFSEQILRPMLSPCTVVDMLGIAVLAGLGEEMLFRGVWQDGFARWTNNPWVGVALASVLFGMLHAITITYALLATAMGAYLGWLYWYTGNLLAPVVTHALYDFLVLLYLLRGPGSQLPVVAEEGEPEAPAQADGQQAPREPADRVEKPG